MLSCDHVARRIPTCGGIHPFDGRAHCAAWNLPATNTKSRAQLLRCGFRVQQECSERLLRHAHSAAGCSRFSQLAKSVYSRGHGGFCSCEGSLHAGRASGSGSRPASVSAYGRIHFENLALRSRCDLPRCAFLCPGTLLLSCHMELKSEAYLCCCAIFRGAVRRLSGTGTAAFCACSGAGSHAALGR